MPNLYKEAAIKITNAKSATLNYINEQKKKSAHELDKIGSGTKVKATDAAMIQIAQALMSDATIMSQGIQNTNDNVAMLQIADGVLQNVSKTTTRLEELNVRANSASLNADQRKMIESEFNAQVKSMSDAMSQASYNGQPLFGKNFTTSLGKSEISVTIPELNTDALSLGDSDALKAFRESINDAASEIGSGMNAYTSAINSLLTTRTNTLAAYSQMADTDIAKSVDNFKNENLLTQSALFTQAHSNKVNQERIQTLLA
ncbi:Flagellin C [hydrothermal vent metagenome]|uniref:Flagellin C n=1 Tax=hydrothermal vent metagenome TaxID=652676 RepID=A0A1W1BEQ7_9ZZZZ